ncbi:hypothetical protein MATL_G00025790 [Megalops atlanticus]|uniref:Uncharacterized protein n=1 Tax=Megalops atlanticus TaxID=7932 RepID=A0A9D3QCX1_MEGAT|nr:hypothetical protein MATL_G00025790 [Megalops atlanticus]
MGKQDETDKSFHFISAGKLFRNAFDMTGGTPCGTPTKDKNAYEQQTSPEDLEKTSPAPAQPPLYRIGEGRSAFVRGGGSDFSHCPPTSGQRGDEGPGQLRQGHQLNECIQPQDSAVPSLSHPQTAAVSPHTPPWRLARTPALSEDASPEPLASARGTTTQREERKSRQGRGRREDIVRCRGRPSSPSQPRVILRAGASQARGLPPRPFC